MNDNTINVSAQPNQMDKSYANATSSVVYPSKDQAIVIESKEGITIKEYISKIATLTNANNIRFVSRISNNRICIFFATKQIAEHITTNHKTINIKDITVSIRSLINKHKRVIISNVCPIIPHETVEAELRKRDIKMTTKLSYLRAGMTEPGFSHIMSFRRQVYIDPDDEHKLPESIPINYDSTMYRIYISTDNMICFTCKQEGHIASHCPKNTPVVAEKTIENPNEKDTESLMDKGPLDQMELEPIQPTPSTSEVTAYHQLTRTENKNVNSFNKRPLSSGSSISSVSTHTLATEVNEYSTNQYQLKEKNKIRKIDNNETNSTQEVAKIKTVEELISPIKDEIESSPEKFVLNYDQFKNFIENSFGSNDPIIIAKDYTDNIQALIDMMKDTYKNLTERSIKGRFTRIIKKLKNSLTDIKSYTEESELDTSD